MNEYEENNVIEEYSNNNEYLIRVFLWMFMGLFATGIVAFVTYSTDTLYTMVSSGMWSIFLIVELVVVLVFNICFRKVSPIVASTLYFIYAIINGISMASIFYCYQLGSVFITFFITAMYFGLLAFIGYTTKKDLSNLGTILFTSLLICVIISIINLFLGYPLIDTVMDWIVLVIFTGITVYDMQKIKEYPQIFNNKSHIYGAMQLYLDFINIFLRILSLFAKRKD